MRILRKGKGLLETFKCKLGYHEWVAVHWSEFKQRPRRAIFSKKGGRRKAQYYEKRYVKYYCMRCGKKRYENKENRNSRSDGLVLEISHNGWQTTCINDLDLEDLKKLRRVIRKAIRGYENNQSV